MAVRPSRNGKKRRIVVYDTTLRDGAQGSFVTFSVADKLLIARALDRIGLDYVEGGFPGSNPKDEEFFASLAGSPLKRSRLAAFGATRRAGGTCEGDLNLAALARSGAPTWTLVGKSDTWQVDRVLQTTLVRSLARLGQDVVLGLRQDLFDHLTTLSLRYFSQQKAGWIIARLTSDVDAVSDVLSAGMPTLIANLVLLPAAIIALLIADWRLGLVVCLTVPPALILTRWFQRTSHVALVETRLPVSTIALNEGFGDLSTFNRLFRRMIGTTPTRFRSAV